MELEGEEEELHDSGEELGGPALPSLPPLPAGTLSLCQSWRHWRTWL
jgi:hypothetical protein